MGMGYRGYGVLYRSGGGALSGIPGELIIERGQWRESEHISRHLHKRKAKEKEKRLFPAL